MHFHIQPGEHTLLKSFGCLLGKRQIKKQGFHEIVLLNPRTPKVIMAGEGTALQNKKIAAMILQLCIVSSHILQYT